MASSAEVARGIMLFRCRLTNKRADDVYSDSMKLHSVVYLRRIGAWFVKIEDGVAMSELQVVTIL